MRKQMALSGRHSNACAAIDWPMHMHMHSATTWFQTCVLAHPSRRGSPQNGQCLAVAFPQDHHTPGPLSTISPVDSTLLLPRAMLASPSRLPGSQPTTIHTPTLQLYVASTKSYIRGPQGPQKKALAATCDAGISQQAARQPANATYTDASATGSTQHVIREPSPRGPQGLQRLLAKTAL